MNAITSSKNRSHTAELDGEEISFRLLRFATVGIHERERLGSSGETVCLAARVAIEARQVVGPRLFHGQANCHFRGAEREETELRLGEDFHSEDLLAGCPGTIQAFVCE